MAGTGRRVWLGATAVALLPRSASAQTPRSFAQRTGSVLTAAPRTPLAHPRVSEFAIPSFPNSHAVWGAIGRDDRGLLWFGVSAVDDGYAAHLFECDPATGILRDRGETLAALRSVRPLAPGEGQIKIHSKPTQADDGLLYFASTDEAGEDEHIPRPPRWGSHLWRLRAGSWEHLLAVPEGLTATAAAGRWVYALGYWDHVLYSFDTQTSATRRHPVGSVPGHMCRNLLVDGYGHAYVPQVRQTAAGLDAELVEFDADLTPLARTRLAHYADDQSPTASHGITGFTFLADQSLVFVTGCGQLYHLAPSATQPATVTPLGWIHPEGPSYTPCLFTWDGIGQLAALGQPANGKMSNGTRRWDWIVFDLATRTSQAVPFQHPFGDRALFYGTHTRDDDGRFYVAGRMTNAEKAKLPVILKLDTSESR